MEGGDWIGDASSLCGDVGSLREVGGSIGAGRLGGGAAASAGGSGGGGR